MKALIFAIALLGLVGHAPGARAQPLNLDHYRGKVVYLDFWASWCTPCKLSFPWMNNLQRTYANDGVVVIGVNVDHYRSAAEAFLKDTPAGFAILFDPKGQIAEKFPVHGMPTSVVIGKDGAIRYSHSGFETSREEEYLSHILMAVKE